MFMAQKMTVRWFATIFLLFISICVTGCSSRTDIGEPRTNISAAEEVYVIGVNAYLWRATLDTLSFMPILSAEQKSGTILTDWKVNPSDQNERTKVDVFIVGKQLRADALKVSIHRETMQNGNWVSIGPRPDAENQLVSAIIVQARLLRRDNAPLTL
jgi:hypothetical protein